MEVGEDKMDKQDIVFDVDKLTEFKSQYQLAKIEGRDMFTFENRKIMVEYAKYMIEYLERRIKEVS